MIPSHIMHGANNYFILIDEWNDKLVSNKPDFVKTICNQERFQSIDSVLFLNQTEDADLEMKIYDRDGSEESMCGNGIRCIAKYFFDNYTKEIYVNIKTGDGNKEASLFDGQIKINMGQPRDVKKINDYYYVFTGCPHLISVSEEYCFEDRNFFEKLGRKISHDKKICAEIKIPYKEGVYVNFVNPKTKEMITYERHVERCTLACGTGNTAVGYILSEFFCQVFPIQLRNKGGIIKIDSESNKILMTGPAEYVRKVFLNN